MEAQCINDIMSEDSSSSPQHVILMNGNGSNPNVNGIDSSSSSTSYSSGASSTLVSAVNNATNGNVKFNATTRSSSLSQQFVSCKSEWVRLNIGGQ